jgi:hypothetical protein
MLSPASLSLPPQGNARYLKPREKARPDNHSSRMLVATPGEMRT